MLVKRHDHPRAEPQVQQHGQYDHVVHRQRPHDSGQTNLESGNGDSERRPDQQVHRVPVLGRGNRGDRAGRAEGHDKRPVELRPDVQ